MRESRSYHVVERTDVSHARAHLGALPFYGHLSPVVRSMNAIVPQL